MNEYFNFKNKGLNEKHFVVPISNNLSFVVLKNHFSDTHKEKLCFIQFSLRMTASLLLTFSISLQNQ